MSKRIKIKKQVYYILIGIILIIGASIFGNYKYKEYKYHQTYEYKLLNHGYKNEDVTKILNNFNEKDYNYFLNNGVNENYIKLLCILHKMQALMRGIIKQQWQVMLFYQDVN